MNNICGTKIQELRKQRKLSQRQLAVKMQLCGLDIEKDCIQKIEADKRGVKDYELICFAEFFNIPCDDLLKQKEA